MVEMITKKSCVIVALIVAVLISLATWLAVHDDHPDSKLHLQDTDILCLESNDMEKAIGVVKDILLEGIPRYAQLSEGYPTVEVFNKDLWPIYEATMDEQRTSYRLTIDEDGGVIELFYRKDNETEARGWPGFTIYVLSNCQCESIDPTYSQRVVVFIRDSDGEIVEHVLRDEIEQ